VITKKKNLEHSSWSDHLSDSHFAAGEWKRVKLSHQRTWGDQGNHDKQEGWKGGVKRKKEKQCLHTELANCKIHRLGTGVVGQNFHAKSTWLRVVW